MPRFFFNVHDGESFIDDQGIELPDLPAARATAIRMSADMLREKDSQFWSGEEWKMEVTDASRMILFTLLFMALDAPCIAGEIGPERPAGAASTSL